MLNEADIEFMRASRDEILSHRERLVSVIYIGKEYDPISGVLIGEGEIPREVTAVVTELSINRANGGRNIEGGIVYKEGDIKVDISIDLIADIVDAIERIIHDGKEYEILGEDKKGIGRRNRFEIIGREIT